MPKSSNFDWYRLMGGGQRRSGRGQEEVKGMGPVADH
jgi:hypothetical protein